MKRVFKLYFSNQEQLTLIRTAYGVEGNPTIQSDRGSSYFESATRTRFVWGNSSQALAVMCLRTAAAIAEGEVTEEDIPFVLRSEESNCAKSVWKSFYRGTERSVANVFFGSSACGSSGASAVMVCARSRGGVRTAYFKPQRVSKLVFEVYVNSEKVESAQELTSLADSVENIFEVRRANDPRVRKTETRVVRAAPSAEEGELVSKREQLVLQVGALELRLAQLNEMVALAEQRADTLVGQLAGKLREAVKGEAGVGALMRVMGEQMTVKPKAKVAGSVLH